MSLKSSQWLAILLSFFLPTFLLVTLSSSQQVYRWIDDNGTIHFTDDVSKIPEQYRDQTKRIELPNEPSKEPPIESQKTGKQDVKEDRVDKYLQDFDKKVEEKKKLEKRVAELEEELRYCEERLKQIEEYEREDFPYYMPFRDPRTGTFVPVGSPYYDEKVRLDRRVREIMPELESLQEKLSRIKRSL